MGNPKRRRPRVGRIPTRAEIERDMAKVLMSGQARLRTRALPTGVPSLPPCSPADGDLCTARAVVMVLVDAPKVRPHPVFLCRSHEHDLRAQIRDANALVAQRET